MPADKNKKIPSIDHSHIPGFPGYRNRSERSGLDPIDNYREEAFMEGLFIRRLFTLKLRTRNPFYLALMLFFSIALFGLWIPFLIGISPNIMSRSLIDIIKGTVALFIVLGIPCLVSIFLMVNFIQCIHMIYGKKRTGGRIIKNRTSSKTKR